MKAPQATSSPRALNCDVASLPATTLSAQISAEALAQQKSAEKHQELTVAARGLAGSIGKCLSLVERQAATVAALQKHAAWKASVAAAATVLRSCCASGPMHPRAGSLDSSGKAPKATAPPTLIQVVEQKDESESDSRAFGDLERKSHNATYQHALDWEALNRCMESMHVPASSSSGGEGLHLSLADLRGILQPETFDESRAAGFLEALEACGMSIAASMAALQQLLADLAVHRRLLERSIQETLASSAGPANSARPQSTRTHTTLSRPYRPIGVHMSAQPSSEPEGPVAASRKCPFMHSFAPPLAARSSTPPPAHRPEPQNAVQEGSSSPLRSSTHQKQPQAALPMLLMHAAHAHSADVQDLHLHSTTAKVEHLGTASHVHGDHGWLLIALQEICGGVLPLPLGVRATADSAGVPGLLGILQPASSGVCPVTGLTGSHPCPSTQAPVEFCVGDVAIVEELDQDGLLHNGRDCHEMLESCTAAPRPPMTANANVRHSEAMSALKLNQKGVPSTDVSPHGQLCPSQHLMHRARSPAPDNTLQSAGDSNSKRCASRCTESMHTQALQSAGGVPTAEEAAEVVRFSSTIAKRQQQLTELNKLRLQGYIQAGQAAVQLRRAQDDADGHVIQQQVCCPCCKT